LAPQSGVKVTVLRCFKMEEVFKDRWRLIVELGKPELEVISSLMEYLYSNIYPIARLLDDVLRWG
jgi:hypothetical protein